MHSIRTDEMRSGCCVCTMAVRVGNGTEQELRDGSCGAGCLCEGLRRLGSAGPTGHMLREDTVAVY